MSKVTLAAHQPNFLPYLGFFDKLKKSDIFVIRDEVLYIKKEYHNRNKIRINSNDNVNNPQSKWLNIPVEDPRDYILHAQIKNDNNWKESFLNEIKNHYGNAPHFEKFFPEFQEIINKEHDKLLSLNMEIIKFFCKVFNLNTKIILASELNLKSKNYEKSDASEDLMNICKATNADVYLSGPGAKEYLNTSVFEEQGINVEFQEFEHPEYSQAYPGFLPYMSALDALFCVGKLPEISSEGEQEIEIVVEELKIKNKLNTVLTQ